jgi:hypothetical protein
MTVGVSLHIGVGWVNADHYLGDPLELPCCETDARDTAALAYHQGFQPAKTLLSEDATSSNVLDFLDQQARQLNPGDILLISYSGHGGQLPDGTGDDSDGLDETWLLYDRQLRDDELYAAWIAFKPEVRIALLSDSCHSGSVAKLQPDPEDLANIALEQLDSACYAAMVDKSISPGFARRLYREHKDVYDSTLQPEPTESMAASLISIAACEDEENNPRRPAEQRLHRLALARSRRWQVHRQLPSIVRNDLPVTPRTTPCLPRVRAKQPHVRTAASTYRLGRFGLSVSCWFFRGRLHCLPFPGACRRNNGLDKRLEFAGPSSRHRHLRHRLPHAVEDNVSQRDALASTLRAGFPLIRRAGGPSHLHHDALTAVARTACTGDKTVAWAAIAAHRPVSDRALR